MHMCLLHYFLALGQWVQHTGTHNLCQSAQRIYENTDTALTSLVASLDPNVGRLPKLYTESPVLYALMYGTRKVHHMVWEIFGVLLATFSAVRTAYICQLPGAELQRLGSRELNMTREVEGLGWYWASWGDVGDVQGQSILAVLAGLSIRDWFVVQYW